MITVRLDKIVSEGRIGKYSERLIVILQVYGISSRPSRYFFHNYLELSNLIGIHEIPNFRTLSYRSRRIDWHKINADIVDLIEINNENTVIDSFIAETCKY